MDDELLESLLEGKTKYKRPQKEIVCIKEIVELFVHTTIRSIQSEEEIPKFNIMFSEEAINYFREVSHNPFQLKDSFTPNIEETDIQNLYVENQCDDNCPTLIVKDYKLFFELLTHIVNEQIALNYNYGENSNARSIAMQLMRRIWLRLGPEDFDNAELFLQKQLDFLKNMEFDNPNEEQKFNFHQENQITYEVEKCETWCETTRRMHFRIYDSRDYHDLPKIYYEIREENSEKVCYIYAVQMGKDIHRIKSIERNLYKLNQGIENSKVHPNFVMAMSLFYELLCSHEITHIKVPLLQVLSHRYHILLGTRAKERFEEKWTRERLEQLEFLKNSPLNRDKERHNDLIENYEYDKTWYEHVVEKEDLISKNKTEGLVNLFVHMTNLDGTSQINTLPFVNAPYLDITLLEQKDLLPGPKK